MWIALYWYIDMRHTQKTFTEFPSNRFYVGPQPRIAITDVDLLKEIMVKEFDSFSDRGFLVSDEI